MIVSIPVGTECIRSITDPVVPNAKTVYALVKASDLPELPLDPDPRIPKVDAKTTRRIRDSLASNRGDFHLLNRGITVSAKSALYDNKSEVLTLELSEEEWYGILDGGHTDCGVRLAVNGMTDEERANLIQYVRLEIMVGVEEHLADIAEARNFSISLKASTLAAYRHEFDWLLDALDADMRKYVRISENDPEPVSVMDLVQILTAVNLTLFPETQAPADAYKNAAKCLSWFIEPDDRYGYKKLRSEAVRLVKLYDYCRLKWQDAYNAPDASGKRGRLGLTAEANQRQRNRVALSTYYFYSTDGEPTRGKYPIEKGLAIPLFSGFRALLQEDSDGQFRFYTDPFKFFDEHGKKLITVIMKSSDSVGSNPLYVGRDPQVYDNIYSEMRRWYLETQFANPRAAGSGPCQLPLPSQTD